MYRYIVCAFASLLLAFAAGCSMDGYDPGTYTGPVLVVTPGAQTDISLMGGSDDAEIIRFDVANHSERDISVAVPSADFVYEDGLAASEGAFTDVKFVDGILRPIEGLSLIHAGETRTFVLRADLGNEAGRYLALIGDYRGLIREAFFEDDSSDIDLSRIVNNRALSRVVDVLPVEMASGGHAVMIANFEPVEALLTAAEAIWQPVGILDVAAYGADLPLESVTFYGPGEAFDGIAIAESDIIIGRASEPLGFIDDVIVTLDTPRLVRDGEHVRLPVWVRIDETSRDLTQLMRTAAIYPHAVSVDMPEGVTLETVVPRSWSYLMLAASAPMMIRQALTSDTLANGIDQDLYRVLVASRSSSQPVTVGSLTVLLDGIPEGRSLTQFRVRVGSSLLAGGYRVLDTDTGADVTTAAGFVPEPSRMGGSVTIVFDGGLRILPGSGQVITLSATPSGFLPGDSLNTTQNFCDFSCPTYQRYYTDYNEADGSLDLFTGMNHERFLDPIVWTDGNAYGLYAGFRYMDYGLLGNSTLSMP